MKNYWLRDGGGGTWPMSFRNNEEAINFAFRSQSFQRKDQVVSVRDADHNLIWATTTERKSS